MPRIPISIAPPPTGVSGPADACQLTLSFQVTTLRYGGGVQARHPDTITPIRENTLRGALRFWWRAFFAYQFPNAAALRAQENEIWGSTERASRIVLKVRSCSEPAPTSAAATTSGNGNRKLEYALFPAQQGLNTIGVLSASGLTFTLEVTADSPESLKHAKCALFAFANFGGYGARTRRGCGSLYCQSLAPVPSNTKDVRPILAHLQKPLFPPGKHQPATDWPSLKNSQIVLGPKALPVQQAWEEVIRLYRAFRQDRAPGSQNRPGRSYWPEPDSIRLIRGTHFRYHAPEQFDRDFPRAILGLPINFKFKDQDRGDPKLQTLEPPPVASNENPRGMRLASPFILKPLMVSQTHAYPMVLRLHSNLLTAGTELNDRLSQLQLKEKDRKAETVSIGSRRADEEFLRFIKTEWNTPALIL